MYRSIVAGTDGSPSAQEAVRHAGQLAALSQATLTIVSAYRPVGHAAVLAMSGAAGRTERPESGAFAGSGRDSFRGVVGRQFSGRPRYGCRGTYLRRRRPGRT